MSDSHLNIKVNPSTIINDLLDHSKSLSKTLFRVVIYNNPSINTDDSIPEDYFISYYIDQNPIDTNSNETSNTLDILYNGFIIPKVAPGVSYGNQKSINIPLRISGDFSILSKLKTFYIYDNTTTSFPIAADFDSNSNSVLRTYKTIPDEKVFVMDIQSLHYDSHQELIPLYTWRYYNCVLVKMPFTPNLEYSNTGSVVTSDITILYSYREEGFSSELNSVSKEDLYSTSNSVPNYESFKLDSFAQSNVHELYKGNTWGEDEVIPSTPIIKAPDLTEDSTIHDIAAYLTEDVVGAKDKAYNTVYNELGDHINNNLITKQEYDILNKFFLNIYSHPNILREIDLEDIDLFISYSGEVYNILQSNYDLKEVTRDYLENMIQIQKSIELAAEQVSPQEVLQEEIPTTNKEVLDDYVKTVNSIIQVPRNNEDVNNTDSNSTSKNVEALQTSIEITQATTSSMENLIDILYEKVESSKDIDITDTKVKNVLNYFERISNQSSMFNKYSEDISLDDFLIRESQISIYNTLQDNTELRNVVEDTYEAMLDINTIREDSKTSTSSSISTGLSWRPGWQTLESK